MVYLALVSLALGVSLYSLYRITLDVSAIRKLLTDAAERESSRG